MDYFAEMLLYLEVIENLSIPDGRPCEQGSQSENVPRKDLNSRRVFSPLNYKASKTRLHRQVKYGVEDVINK